MVKVTEREVVERGLGRGQSTKDFPTFPAGKFENIQQTKGGSGGGIFVTAAPTFVSGGGGKQSTSTTAQAKVRKTTTKVSPAVARAREQTRLAAGIRARAKKEGVSPSVQARRERRDVAREVRAEARARGVDVSTRVREKAFVRELVKEEREPTQVTPQFQPSQKTQTQSIGEVEKRDINFRDVNLLKTAFPDIAKRRGKTGGVTLQTFAEFKGQRALNVLGERVLGRIPQGGVKGILSTKVKSPGLITGIAKFGAFSPLTATTPEVVSGLVKSGQIKPVAETTFKATVTPKGDISKVDLVLVSKVGGKTTGTTSKQLVQTSDDISKAIGSGVTGTRKGASKVEFVKSEIVGVGKRTGEARLVADIGGVKGSTKLGTGVESKAVTIDVAKVTQRRGIGGVDTRTNLVTIKDVKLTKATKPSDTVTGLLTKIGENKIGFVGTTDRPITSISRTGITKRIPLENVNVRGVIETTKAGGSETIIFAGGKTGTVTDTIQTQVASTLSGAITKSQTAAIKGAITESTKVSSIGAITSPTFAGTRSVTSISKATPKTITTTKTTQSISNLPKQKLIDQTQQKFSNLGVLGLRVDTSTKQRPRSKTIQTESLTQRGALDLGQKSLTQQKQSIRQVATPITRTFTKQRTRQTFAPTISIPAPKTTTGRGLPPFKFPSSKSISTPRGRFGVSVRRRGKFKTIGTGLSLSKAISVGQTRVGRTLAATFRVAPTGGGLVSGGVRTPKGFRRGRGKDRSRGLTFVELPKQRLSTGSEVVAIQTARRVKKR